jgi:Zn-dependent peptidase ImmA (M78 family)
LAGPYRDERAAALRLRFHERFDAPGLPVPVEAIAEDLLGLAVGERDDLEASGMLLPARREIWLNATEIPARRRFTLAHELGHWVCQCLAGRSDPIYCRTADVAVGAGHAPPENPDRTLEREANIFAAELLMPEEAVRDEWSRSADRTELADRFGVSGEAMQWRLYGFGLVEERPS